MRCQEYGAGNLHVVNRGNGTLIECAERGAVRWEQ
jgi:hypothetical protein